MALCKLITDRVKSSLGLLDHGPEPSPLYCKMLLDPAQILYHHSSQRAYTFKLRRVKPETTESRDGGGAGETSRDNVKGVRVEDIGKPSTGRIIPIFLLDIHTSTKHKDYTCLYGHMPRISREREF